MGATGRSNPDVIADGIAVEVKHRKKLPTWIKEAIDKVQSEGVISAVWLHELNSREDYVIVKHKDFLRLLEAYREKGEQTDKKDGVTIEVSGREE